MALVIRTDIDRVPYEIKDLKSRLDEVYFNLGTNCETVFNGCEGESINALKDLYEKVNKDYEDLSAYLENVSASLKKSVDEFRERDAEIARSIAGKLQ